MIEYIKPLLPADEHQIDPDILADPIGADLVKPPDSNYVCFACYQGAAFAALGGVVPYNLKDFVAITFWKQKKGHRHFLK